jgi:hypothetical protein
LRGDLAPTRPMTRLVNCSNEGGNGGSNIRLAVVAAAAGWRRSATLACAGAPGVEQAKQPCARAHLLQADPALVLLVHLVKHLLRLCQREALAQRLVHHLVQRGRHALLRLARAGALPAAPCCCRRPCAVQSQWGCARQQ